MKARESGVGELSDQQVTDSSGGRRLALVALGITLLAFGVWFHVWRLAQTPGWDPQEGYNLDLAWNLLHGRLRLFALTQDFVQHPPLYYLQLALFIRLFGYSIVAVRALAACYAILTSLALLLIGWRMLGAAPAVWGTAVYIVAPVMLENSRWGYSYGVLAFVGLFCLWAAWESLHADNGETRLRWLLIAAALAGIAAFSDYIGVAWIVFVALVGWRQSGRRGALALGLGAGIVGLGLLILLALSPAVFVADFFSTGGRAAGGNPLISLVLLLFNYQRLATYDAWLLLGIVGLFLAPQRRTRDVMLGAVALLALVILKVRTLGPSFHTGTPLLPLLALGAGMTLAAGAGRLFEWAYAWLIPIDRWFDRRKRRGLAAGAGAEPMDADGSSLLTRVLTAALVFLVIGSPLAMTGASDAVGLAGKLVTPQDALLATSQDAQTSIAFILAHSHRGDLVLASPQLAWAFDQPVGANGRALGISGADIVQSVAFGGQAAAFYPGGLQRERWAYDVSIASARFVIVDDLIRQLAAPDQMPALTPIVREAESWPAVYSRGQYTVYQRP